MDRSRFKYRRKEFFLPVIGLMVIMFLATLDSTIVSTALPTIANIFGRIVSPHVDDACFVELTLVLGSLRLGDQFLFDRLRHNDSHHRLSQ